MKKIPFATKIFKKRTNIIVNLFEEFIEKEEKILDIGAGPGWIGKEIQKRKKTKVLLLDIIDFNQTDLKLVLYDGQNMPFQENSFDTSLLIFTLHHCKDPLRVLKEAKRVTKRKIIIAEDVPTHFLNKILLYFWDVVFSLLSLVKPPGESIYFNFKDASGWKKIFDGLGLKLVFQKNFSSFKIISHTLFVLKVP